MEKRDQMGCRALRALVTVVTFAVIAASSVVCVEARETTLDASINTTQKAPCVDASREQLYLTRSCNYNKPIYVVRCRKHTKVYIGATILWDRHWFALSEETFLIDTKSGDKYMLHSSGTGLPIDTLIWMNDLKGKYVYFELIFPPLDKGVDRVDLFEWTKAATTRGYGKSPQVDGVGWSFTNVMVEKKLPYFVSKKFQAAQDRGPRVIRLDKDFEPK